MSRGEAAHWKRGHVFAVMVSVLFVIPYSMADTAMDSQVQQLFDTAVQSSGAEYVAARKKLSALPSAQIEQVRSQTSHPDWRVALQVEIILGWSHDSDRYKLARELADGTHPSLKPERYQSGKPTPEIAARAILQLGSPIAPAMMELVYKEGDLTSNYAFSVSSKTLVTWGGPVVVNLYRELLADSRRKLERRMGAIRPLIDLRAVSLFDDLLVVVANPRNEEKLRTVALTSTGETGDPRAFSLLKETLETANSPLSMKVAAADGLGSVRNADVATVLLRNYAPSAPGDLRAAIINALHMSQSKSAIEPLRKVMAVEPDEELRRVARNAIRDLNLLD